MGGKQPHRHSGQHRRRAGGSPGRALYSSGWGSELLKGQKKVHKQVAEVKSYRLTTNPIPVPLHHSEDSKEKKVAFQSH